MEETNERNLQAQIQVQIQELDDVFHRTIISLERLELYLGTEKETRKTAIGSERDKHPDSIEFNEDDYFDELAIDCCALLKNRINDGKIFQNAVSFFVNDILEWYAGREGLDFNEVDAAIIPILVALTQQVKKTREVDELFQEYVHKSVVQEYTIEEKYEGTVTMLTSLILAADIIQNEKRRIHESPDLLTKHFRGDAIDGYRRIYKFMSTKYYSTTFPIKVFIKTINEFAPQIANCFPKVTIEAVEDIIFNNGQSTIVDSFTDNTRNELSKDDVLKILMDMVKSKLDDLGFPYNTININID